MIASIGGVFGDFGRLVIGHHGEKMGHYYDEPIYGTAEPIVTNTPRAGEDPTARERRGKPPYEKPKLSEYKDKDAHIVRPLPALNRQVGGNHYTKMPIQVFEFTMANGLDPMQHTVIKYVTRFRDKGGVEDLEKAKHTIDLLIEYEKLRGSEG